MTSKESDWQNLSALQIYIPFEPSAPLPEIYPADIFPRVEVTYVQGYF